MSESGKSFNPYRGYVQSGIHPLPWYGVLVAIYSALFAGFLAAVRRSGKSLPDQIAPGDLLLLGIGAYRFSRLATKDSVTSIFRAPFTEFEHPIGDGEVEEKPRGTGFRHAIGELVVCPFCLGQWIAAFFAYGIVLAPRFTRLVAGLFVISTISNVLQLASDAAKRAVMQLPQAK